MVFGVVVVCNIVLSMDIVETAPINVKQCRQNAGSILDGERESVIDFLACADAIEWLVLVWVDKRIESIE